MIAGTARDVAPFLDRTLSNIEALAGSFARAHVVLHECLSADDSRARLEAWSRSTPLSHDLSFRPLDHSNRIVRIARGRNECLSLLEESPAREHDLLIMLDMDDANGSGPLDVVGVHSSLDLDVEWDVVCANQRNYYYDYFALRTERNSVNAVGPDGLLTHNRPHPLSAWFDAPRLLDISHIPVDHPPLPVLSAFGGLALYRMAAIRGLTYEPERIGTSTERDSFEFDCEHVALHRRIRDERGGRIWINPRMVNRTYPLLGRLWKDHGASLLRRLGPSAPNPDSGR